MCPFLALSGKYHSHALACLEYALFHVKTRLLVSIFSRLFLLVSFIDVYVWNLTAIPPSRDRKRKYFQLTLQGKEVERGSVILPREAEIAAKNPKLNKQDAHYKIR